MTERDGADRPASGCGMPLLILWGLQGLIDEGRITTAEAIELLRPLAPGGGGNGSGEAPDTP